MMWFNGKADRKTRSILVKGRVAFSNVKTTACVAHMCPHSSRMLSVWFLYSHILHQYRFSLHTRRRREAGMEVGSRVIICFSALAFGVESMRGGNSDV